jgi:hypothetical protein
MRVGGAMSVVEYAADVVVGARVVAALGNEMSLGVFKLLVGSRPPCPRLHNTLARLDARQDRTRATYAASSHMPACVWLAAALLLSAGASASSNCPITQLNSTCLRPCLDGALRVDNAYNNSSPSLSIAGANSTALLAWTVTYNSSASAAVFAMEAFPTDTSGLSPTPIPMSSRSLAAIQSPANLTLVFYLNLTLSSVYAAEIQAGSQTSSRLVFDNVSAAVDRVEGVYAGGRFVAAVAQQAGGFAVLTGTDLASLSDDNGVLPGSLSCVGADEDGTVLLVSAGASASSFVYGLGLDDNAVLLQTLDGLTSPCFMASSAAGQFLVLFAPASAGASGWAVETTDGGATWSAPMDIGDVYVPSALVRHPSGYFVLLHQNRVTLPAVTGQLSSTCRVNAVTFHNLSEFVPRFSAIEYDFASFSPSIPMWFYLPPWVTTNFVLGQTCSGKLTVLSDLASSIVVMSETNFDVSSLVQSKCGVAFAGAPMPPTLAPATSSPTVAPTVNSTDALPASPSPAPSSAGAAVGGVLGVLIFAGLLFAAVFLMRARRKKIAQANYHEEGVAVGSLTPIVA